MSFHSGGKMSAALALRDELPRALEQTREPAKILAFKAGVSKRTIESARRGEHVISAPALLSLAREYPQVRALVLRLIGATDDDPSRVLNEIQKLIQGVVK